MSVLLQISDPHFGTEQPLVAEALVTLAKQQRPDLLVLSGDITQRARPAQFRAARAFMDRLGAPFLAVPGNHDIPLLDLWTRLRRPYAGHAAAFGTDLEPVYTSPDLMVVVHQPIAVMRPQDAPNLLRGHTAALQRLAAAGADIVMGGHIHLPYVMALSNLVRPLWVVQAGTAISSRVRRGVPNSVNLLRWGSASEADCCRVEQWGFSDTTRTFVRCKVTEIGPIHND